MVYFLQAKPNKTYYQMDTSSFAKGGVSRLQTPFSGERFRGRRFLFRQDLQDEQQETKESLKKNQE